MVVSHPRSSARSASISNCSRPRRKEHFSLAMWGGIMQEGVLNLVLKDERKMGTRKLFGLNCQLCKLGRSSMVFINTSLFKVKSDSKRSIMRGIKIFHGFE